MWRESVEWVRRARQLIPREDRRVLLSPPRLVARFARFALHRHGGDGAGASADDVAARDPELIGLFLDFFAAFGRRYFRLEVQGVEHVPPSGPVLLVANHSGGLVPVDGFFISLAIYEKYGPGRAVYALTHDFMFDDEVLRRYALRLGMLRAGRHSAEHAFAAGHCVLVYPGGDWETFRPFSARGRVDLDGRTGFVELALRARVPIVPIACAGSHEQFVVLTRGERLARLVHAHAWARTDVFPLVLALPWGLTVGFVPYLPLPAQMSIAFGAPMTWREFPPSAADDPVVCRRIYDEVEGTMQAMLDRLDEGRRFLVGRRAS